MSFHVLPLVDICPKTGGGHIDSPVGETTSGGEVYECLNCRRREAVEFGPESYVDQEVDYAIEAHVEARNAGEAWV